MRILIGTCAAMLLVSVRPGRAGEEGTAPEAKTDVRVVKTEQGLVLAFTPSETGPSTCRVRALEAKAPAAADQATEVRLPEESGQLAEYRLVLVCDPAGCFRVVTAKEKAEVRAEEGKRMWLHFTEVAGVPLRTIATERALLLKPRHERPAAAEEKGEEAEEGEAMEQPVKKGKLLGFEVVATVPEGPKDASGIERAGKGPETTMEHTRVFIDLPRDVAEDLSYGVLLRPLWREPGKSIHGFEAVLVSCAATKAATEEKGSPEEEAD